MSTLRELIDSNRTLADATFAQAAAINKLVPVFEHLRRDIYDVKTDREIDVDKMNLALGKIDTALAIILDNVKDAKGDVRTLTRDVTGAHPVPPLPPLPERSDSAALQLVKAIVAAPLTTKLSLILLCALGLLIYALITGGHHG